MAGVNPVNFVTGIAQAVNSYLQDKLTQQWGQDTIAAINELSKWVTDGWQGLTFSGQQEQGSVQYSDQYATQIGHDFEQIEGTTENTISHVAFTILPNSLQYTVGYIVSRWIGPLQVRMTAAENFIQRVDDDVIAIHAWLFPYASNAVAEWYAFAKWWNANFAAPADTLIDWLKHPAHFGEWAAYPVLGPIIAYLQYPAHDEYRDALNTVVLRAWSEHPGDTLTEIELWLIQPIK